MKKVISTAMALLLLLAVPAAAAEATPAQTAQAVSETTTLFQLPMELSAVLKPEDDMRKAQILYSKIEAGLEALTGLDGKAYIDLSGCALSGVDGGADAALLDRVYSLVYFNHPEFCYATGGYVTVCESGVGEPVLGVRPEYNAFAKQPGAVETFRAAADEIYSRVKDISDPVECMLAVYDALAVRNVYNWQVGTGRRGSAPPEAWNAYSALVTGDTVCKGYAMAYRLLLNRCGIPCIAVGSPKMNHIWNIVMLDGQCYHVDVNCSNFDLPSLPGRSIHSRFLLSDETIREKYGFHGWTAFGPMGWNVAAPACTSKQYEAGWAFNGTELPLYRWDGNYFYLQKAEKWILFQGGLSGAGTAVAALPLYSRGGKLASGIVWAGGCLYYIDESTNLVCCTLGDGQRRVLGHIPFTAQPSPDGAYPAELDGIGLRYAPGEIRAVSRTRRNGLAVFPLSE